MASMEFKNNARSTVADNPLAAGATTLNVATGEGANFPSSFPFKLTLSDPATYPDPGMEITKCTGRTADALTIARGQEGTADVEHAFGERVAMLFTAGHFNDPTTGIVTKLDTIETDAKDDQTASEVPIVDSGSIITATDVEDALQENRTAIDLNTAKDTNVDTNLSEGTNTETTVDVNSSDGTNATLVAASTIRAGLLTKAKFDEIVANNAKETNVVYPAEIATTIGALIGGADNATPNNTDFVATSLTAAGILKKITWTNVKAFLKTYNDTLYAAVLGADDNYVTDAEKVIIGNTSGANTGDDPADDTAYNESTWNANTDAATKNSIRDQIETMLTAIGLNTAKDSNATHTGEVTGSGALTIDKTAISGKDVVTAVGADHVLIGDTSDAGNLKKALVSDLTGAGTTITSESFSSSPAHLTTDQDAGKAFTISSFPTHAQIKKISIRADFTAGQQSNVGTALVNDGTGIAPADTEITYDNAIADFAAGDYSWLDDECVYISADSGSVLTVSRGEKGTIASYHDDNTVITKANHGVRLVLFEDSNKLWAERIIELSTMMTYKGVTDDAISANDDYFGLTADMQNLGNGDFLVIEDTVEEVCRVQNVNHNVASATYDYTIFVQDDLAAHDTTKDVKKLIVFDLDVPYSSGAGTLHGTVFADEKIVATLNVKVEIETDSYT